MIDLTDAGLYALGELMEGSGSGALASYLMDVREAARAESAGEVERLRARVAAIEAPPVVPDGWEVHDDDALYLTNEAGEMLCESEHDAGALRAFAWAMENRDIPPHAADVKGGG